MRRALSWVGLAAFLHGCGSTAPAARPAAFPVVAAADTLAARIVVGPPLRQGERYLFTYHAPDARSVAVAGTFNGWLPAQHMMEQRDGVWFRWLEIPRGRHRYKFLVDGVHWLTDPENPRQAGDGAGGRASALTVP